MTKKITIAIVDDHKLIRQLWEKMFAGNKDMVLTGEAGTLDEAVAMIGIKRPDIVLLDITLEDESGMDAVPLIRRLSPGTKIIAVSMHNQPAYAKRMLQLGAKGYVTKNSAYAEMVKAIQEVMKGNEYVCTEIKDRLADHATDIDFNQPGIKDLSFREIGIIKLMKEGLASKEIAVQLKIAIRTVEAHRYNILKKLNFKNTASLINFINNTDLTFL